MCLGNYQGALLSWQSCVQRSPVEARSDMAGKKREYRAKRHRAPLILADGSRCTRPTHLAQAPSAPGPWLKLSSQAPGPSPWPDRGAHGTIAFLFCFSFLIVSGIAGNMLCFVSVLFCRFHIAAAVAPAAPDHITSISYHGLYDCTRCYATLHTIVICCIAFSA